MGKRADQFIQVVEVIPIHIHRYNSIIDRLLKMKDYSLDDLIRGRVDKSDYYKAKERRIRAYSDCISTMIQKEKILQYHNPGFQLEVINEKIEVKSSKPEYDLTKLTLDEQIEVLEFIKKTKQAEYNLLSVIQGNREDQVVTEDVAAEIVETANIEQIKQKELPAMPLQTITTFDPTAKLRESLKKIAALKLKEIGGKLDQEEEKYLSNEKSKN
ncbi:hypothetical protein [Flavihumibacter profundi]|uniref:hypothetical protein n=1 Tax=Flavihumibacter profundi TaxID=2716883 RepID=UPI001CC5A768|nr:hypothetical protein [Flavihumibacter profundi]MBZ5859444.1 hypothetical protein [Flavihumibacter profundi]